MSIMTDIVKEWPVFNENRSELNKLSVKLIYVFGVKGEEVFIVTNGDDVYALGPNVCGSLGFGHKNAVNKLTKVERLCNKQIESIASNNYSEYEFVLLLQKTVAFTRVVQ